MPISLRKAALYEKFRPTHADEAIVELLSTIGSVDVVADVGAGTGQLARLFTSECSSVYVVEPDSSMRTVAQKALGGCLSIQIVNGSAEGTSLPDGGVDLIVIGDAFHRFRPEACTELRRILKDGGWVALFGNPRVKSEFEDVLFSKLAALESLASRTEKAWHRMSTEHLFGVGAIQNLRSRPRPLTRDWEAFFGAACSGVEAPEPEDEEFTQFEAINREVFEVFAVDGEIPLNYETTVSFGQPRMPD